MSERDDERGSPAPEWADGLDPYDILPRDEADRLTDALARIVLAAARVRAARRVEASAKNAARG